jgi:hypothetical protein
MAQRTFDTRIDRFAFEPIEPEHSSARVFFEEHEAAFSPDREDMQAAKTCFQDRFGDRVRVVRAPGRFDRQPSNPEEVQFIIA